MDPFVIGVGADLSVLFGDKDDCWQVTGEGLSVSSQQFPWQYFFIIRQAAEVLNVHRLRESWLGVRSRCGGDDEEKEGSHRDLHVSAGQCSSRGEQSGGVHLEANAQAEAQKKKDEAEVQVNELVHRGGQRSRDKECRRQGTLEEWRNFR